MTNRTPKTKMGAGIAADPRSPDFDPLEVPFGSPAPSGFGGMLSRCRGGHLALRFWALPAGLVRALANPRPTDSLHPAPFCPFEHPETFGCRPGFRHVARLRVPAASSDRHPAKSRTVSFRHLHENLT